eukprot:jgi/Chlat1/4337/Chrsp29S04496
MRRARVDSPPRVWGEEDAPPPHKRFRAALPIDEQPRFHHQSQSYGGVLAVDNYVCTSLPSSPFTVGNGGADFPDGNCPYNIQPAPSASPPVEPVANGDQQQHPEWHGVALSLQLPRELLPPMPALHSPTATSMSQLISNTSQASPEAMALVPWKPREVTLCEAFVKESLGGSARVSRPIMSSTVVDDTNDIDDVDPQEGDMDIDNRPNDGFVHLDNGNGYSGPLSNGGGVGHWGWVS